MLESWKRGMLKLAGSNALLALLAIGSGLGAVIAARHYINSEVRRIEARSEARYRPTPVVVAQADLPAGEPLAAGALAVRRMPSAYLPAGTIAGADAAMLIGRSLGVSLQRGDPLTRAMLMPAGAASLSSRLPDGFRALTLAVDDISSQSGMLVPGDEIDLYLAQSRGAAGARLALLLQRLPVLATGSQVQQKPGDETDNGYGTITVKASVDDAARIILAQQAGALSIVLRGRGDHAPALLTIRDSRDLMHAARRTAAAGQRLPAIEVLLGGDGNAEPRRMWLRAGEQT